MATQAKAAPAPATNIPPNQTLYVTNLPSAKIQKQDLRRSLYLLFSTYGSVLDVVALKTTKMRGQAHIAFKDVQSAKWAMQELQGFELLGSKIKIDYAKAKSRKVAMMDGTFKLPEKSSEEQKNASASSELQKSIFAGPPPGTSSGTKPAGVAGTKRPREDEEEKVIEEESDSDVEMEMDEDEEDDD